MLEKNNKKIMKKKHKEVMYIQRILNNYFKQK